MIMRIKPLLLALMAVLPLASNAQVIKDGVLTDASGAPVNYEIPDGVKEIGAQVFIFSSLKSVTIPASVEVIHEMAFYNASNLEKVTFAPNSKLKTIGEQAFEGCTALKEIELPNSLDSLGKSAFTWCEALKKVKMPAHLKKVSYGAFSSCGSLAQVDFPTGIQEIGEFSFANCANLKSINLNGVKVIGTKAFYNCKTLADVTLGEGLEELKDSVFERCNALTELTIPASMKKSGAKLFFRCPNFEGFKVAEGSQYMMAENGVLYSKNKEMLYECPQKYSAETFVVPNETKRIYHYAFFGCKDVKSIKIPATLERLGVAALANNGMTKFDFAGNDNLPVRDGCIYYRANGKLVLMAVPTKGERKTFVLLPETSLVGNYAFAFNETAADIYIPETCLGIGDMAFYACKGLKNFYCYGMKSPQVGECSFGLLNLPGIQLHVKPNTHESYASSNWVFTFGSDITDEYPKGTDGINGVEKRQTNIRVNRWGNDVRIMANAAIKAVELYSLAGAKIDEKQVNGNEATMTLPTGNVNIVKVTLENGTKKVVKL